MTLACKYNFFMYSIYNIARLCILIRFIIRGVRRAVLLNIEINEKTIPHIFKRARDVDPSIRRSVYTKLAEEIADFRVLSIEAREKLLKWGFTDR